MLKLWNVQIKDFRNCVWPRDQNGDPIKWESSWMYLYGPTGTGKTTYARHWVEKWGGWPIIQCWTFADQLQRECEDEGNYKRHLDRLETHPWMAFDDLGSETEKMFTLQGKKHTKRTTGPEMMETAMEVRHRLNLPTIYTSNLSPISHQGTGDLTTMTGDEDNWSSFQSKYGPKLHSRLIELATIYNMQGNRRPEQAGLAPETEKTIELISKPTTQSDYPLIPCEKDPYAGLEKPMTEREWQRAIKKADLPLKPHLMKWHALWKKEKEKANGRQGKQSAG